MNLNLLGASEIPHTFGFVERRRKLRIKTPFQARIRGCDARGRRFKCFTYVCNLSAGGIYLRLTQFAAPGSRVCIAIRLKESHVTDAFEPGRVLMRGTVVRVEAFASDACGVAIVVNRHRFF